MTRILLSLLALCMVALLPRGAHARTLEECQAAWGQATRSYLTGKPEAIQDNIFKKACEMDVKGDKDPARVEAVAAAASALVKQGEDICERFIKSYVGISEAEGICQAEDPAAMRKAIEQGLPAKSEGGDKPKKTKRK